MSQHDAQRRASVPLDEIEQSHLAGRLRLRAALIYEIVRSEGERELARPTGSLFWSGFAAGISIALSLVAEGILQAYLPEAPWRHLVASFGYTAGFLIVVLGQQQLFTENTITAVLPVLAKPSRHQFACMFRLWGTVLVSNIVGTAVIGALLAHMPLVEAEVHAAMLAISQGAMALDPATMFWTGLLAGWLVATMVWLMPGAESAAIYVIFLLSYLIAIAGLSHVIVGSVEAAFLLFQGELGPSDAVLGFFLPTLAGNVVGGSALFALLSYAQVRREMQLENEG